MSISWQDESALTWYFGVGQTRFERSTTGPMLAHAEMFGQAGELRYCERAAGYELQAERIRRAPAAWASVCDGAIVYSGCEVTARPTAEVREASGYLPELKDMERHAEVGGVLRVVARRCPIAWYALQAYYGDLAADWQRTLPKPGKIGALYHITEAGRRLLQDSAAEALKRGQPIASSPARRLQNECAMAKKSERTRVRLMQCERQALLLRAEAFAAWCEARVECRTGRAA
jgi:hypothetical protein